MTIFVTGGTGFVGRAIIRKLLQEGEEVRALYRDEKRCRIIDDPKVTWIKGEIGDIESLHRGVAGADCVIHLVGILVEPGAQTFEAIHVRGTENILEAAKRSGVRRLLHMSALGTRPEAASRYHQTKWKAEGAVCASSLEATIFRPSLIFGRGDVSLNLFSKIISYSPFIPIPGTGGSRQQPVWVEDVAECFVRSLERPVSIGKTYPLCGPRPYTMDALFEMLLRVKKASRPKLHVPIWLLTVPAALGERILSHPPLTRDQLIMLQEDNISSDDAAAKDLGVTFKGPEEILPAYIR